MSDTPSQPSDATARSPLDPATTGLAPNIAAGIACLFTIVGGIVFLVLEKKDKFVRFWAMQSVFLGGLALAVPIVFRIAQLVFDFIPFVGKLMMLALGLVNMLFGIAWFIVYLICVVKAFSRQEWEIPWLGKLARKQLEQLDGAAAPPAA
ncbi:MAG: hypothetical protein WCF18_01685 [Chthoniobacteraceae bacterium]